MDDFPAELLVKDSLPRELVSKLNGLGYKASYLEGMTNEDIVQLIKKTNSIFVTGDHESAIYALKNASNHSRIFRLENIHPDEQLEVCQKFFNRKFCPKIGEYFTITHPAKSL